MDVGEKIKAGIIGAAITAAASLGAYFLGWLPTPTPGVGVGLSPAPSEAPQGPPPEEAVIEAVIDPVTVRLTSGHMIRYIGVQTPSIKQEVQCFGKEALIANESVIGQGVRLEEEPLLLRSRDGAWTRYVFLLPEQQEGASNQELVISNDDAGFETPSLSSSVQNDSEDETDEEIFINERILEVGFGFPVVSKDMKYGERLLSAARFASATGKGLWSRCEVIGDAPDLSTQAITECVIKGKATESGETFYRTPECEGYKDTVVLQYKGGYWFCSEEEAKEVGFEKAEDCS